MSLESVRQFFAEHALKLKLLNWPKALRRSGWLPAPMA